ncbi:MAG TPA: methylenetetrahydrofolate--tRNA-(uracil(54)-C(5))-methyltransferase (FADH(2)-oxidizing) TrmFO [Acholeplasmatales bacterium]|nr:MAG: methylenetetrahydrofolate--tRNA-(uracil(54)-C(5))-methyltransferase (FADH(2)-oxidizing) TrmFO [Tenericutes bacterium GWF2_57_13]HAQ57049.1 methylenetetrahydrofolate--tRNA-(uracil(54)-C(5))-methyltransferase (FADH(2)-oxidizing) TrmFO [Acholeplasmatales bacterium]
MTSPFVTVIGAGLAGVEAAYQLARRGIRVRLVEMKKIKKSPAHMLDGFAELVCSNSLGSDSLQNANGILKEELRLLGSIVIKIADEVRVPAGSALAVDRLGFSERLTAAIRSEPLIEIIDAEATSIPDGHVIIATGPLTSDAMFEALQKLTGEDTLYFYDAAAPIVEFDSIDMSKAYFKSRYDKGEATYINCPMTKAEYDMWYDELVKAECVEAKEFELKVFEGCMPFEEMAKRGRETLLYGPMKPVGLEIAHEKRSHAVVQLRRDNAAATLYNIVGFQTHLTFPEQRRILRMIPGLENARFARYGVMHRNSFLNAPKILDRYYRVKTTPRIYIAGQLSGVEGYVESVGSGLAAALNMARQIRGWDPIAFPDESVIGALARYLANTAISDFQPMNANFGLFPPLETRTQRQQRKTIYGERALAAIRQMIGDGILDKP